MDWFLYDNDPRHERVNEDTLLMMYYQSLLLRVENLKNS